MTPVPGERMRAVVLTHFGPPDVLRLQEVARPVPGERDVLVRVRATTASAGDCELRALRGPILFRAILRLYFGLLRPKPIVLGQEVAGDVVSVGAAVTRFRAGDAVFGWTGFRLGGYAEYACLREGGVLAAMPANATYEASAPLAVGGLEAVQFLRRGRVRSGERVLVIGAGGGIGAYAVQIAKHLGAHVTAVDHAAKLDMLRAIGADRVIDYTREPVTRSGETYDVVFDVPGKASVSRIMWILTANGRFLMGNPRATQKLRAAWAARGTAKETIPWASRTPGEYAEDIAALKALVEGGGVRTVIDRTYPLAQAAEAHRYVDTGAKKGNVVIVVKS